MDSNDTRQHVVVRDIQMPFSSMVVFIIKWTIAAIPAFIILLLIGFAVSAAVLPAIRRVSSGT